MEFVSTALQSEDFEVIPLAGDASTRKYFRVVMGSRSWVLMSWDPFVDDENYPFLSVLDHFAQAGVHVPEIIAKSPENGMVLMEDLGDLTLERKVWEYQNQKLVLPFYQQAIDELIRIHYHATDARHISSTAFRTEFNTDKFLWEMNYGREHVLEKLCKLKLTEAVSAEIQRIFLEICSRLDREPKRISHRDYHSRNLMIKLNRMYVIDFQDARMGPIQYDLVSLIHDSYVNLDAETSENILNYYLAQASPWLGNQFSRDQFDEVFRLQKIQRCFKACGSFASFFNQRGDTRYLKYLQPTLNKVARTLEEFPAYGVFRSLLIDNGLLDKKFDVL